MGYDINIIARHRLNTENVESLAKDLSEALDINIEYGYHHEYVANIKKRVIKDAYNYHWISLGKIIRGSDKDTYRLEDKRYEQKNIYNLLGSSFEGVQFKDVYKGYFEHLTLYELHQGEKKQGDIFYMNITDEVASISMYNEPFRWHGFYMNFNEQEANPESWKVLNDYRRIVRKNIKGIGADYVYFHPDQGTPELICDQLHLSWEKMEEYILTRTYIKESCSITKEKIEDCKSEIMDIPSFMSADKKIFSENYEDVFRDDFSDLDE
jgi:hypothetical protein